MKSKILVMLLAIVAAICLAFGLSACGEHEHDWGEWQLTTPATCSSKGEETRTCKLDSKHKETREVDIDPNAHKLKHISAKAATCASKGWKAYDECELCGYNTKIETEINPEVHTYDVDNLCVDCHHALNYTQNLSYQLNSDNQSYSLIGIGTATDNDIVIPYGYNNKPVTSIGESAFEDCSNLQSITISDSVTSIGDSAFERCISLESVTIGNGITSIGNDSFSYCTSLESITIPNNVTFIDNYAFEDCTKLTNITIGDGVTSIENFAFYHCPSLKNITVDTNNKNYSSWDGILFNKDKTTLIKCPETKTYVDIPNSVTSIDYWAFRYCESLTSITIPDSVTSIGALAFDLCTSLESINIPDSVTSIGDRAFLECDSLKNITVDTNNKYFSSQDDILYDKDKTVLIQCAGAKTSVSIPNSVTSIGDCSFYGCTRLTSVKLKNGQSPKTAAEINVN